MGSTSLAVRLSSLAPQRAVLAHLDPSPSLVSRTGTNVVRPRCSIPPPAPSFLTRCDLGCGEALGEAAEQVDDTACRGVCTADHSQFCGHSNRIAVYSFTPSAEPPIAVCNTPSVANFTLVAEYKEPAEEGPTSVSLKVLAVEMASNVVWTIISVSVPHRLNLILDTDLCGVGLRQLLLRMACTLHAKQRHLPALSGRWNPDHVFHSSSCW